VRARGGVPLIGSRRHSNSGGERDQDRAGGKPDQDFTSAWSIKTRPLDEINEGPVVDLVRTGRDSLSENRRRDADTITDEEWPVASAISLSGTGDLGQTRRERHGQDWRDSATPCIRARCIVHEERDPQNRIGRAAEARTPARESKDSGTG